MDLERLKEQLVRHEGLRLAPYLCPAGKVTLGAGVNLEAHPEYLEEWPGGPDLAAQVRAGGLRSGALLERLRTLGFGWSRERALAALDDQVRGLEADLRRTLPDLRPDLSEPRLAVLLNMAFNLGPRGLRGFRKMLAAVNRGQWERAADEMLDSQWAEEVGDWPPGTPKADRLGRPGRAWELAEQMRTGQWP